MVNLGKSEPVAIEVLRFDPNVAENAEYKSTLFYHPDFGYELGFRLDGKPFTAFTLGEPDPETSFGIDRNGDGKISTFRERIRVGKPFNFTGTTYTFTTAPNDGLALATTASALPQAPMPPDLAVGKMALPIQRIALDGKPVDLMKDYKGKIVMLDFWATWCGPCVGELPNVKAAYDVYHDRGFDVLGISFDEAGFADRLRAFTKERGMPWRQVYEGKAWSTEVGTAYDVGFIPFTLLIDGDTGRILADERDLRGPGLSDFIGKKLAEKRAGK